MQRLGIGVTLIVAIVAAPTWIGCTSRSGGPDVTPPPPPPPPARALSATISLPDVLAPNKLDIVATPGKIVFTPPFPVASPIADGCRPLTVRFLPQTSPWITAKLFGFKGLDGSPVVVSLTCNGPEAPMPIDIQRGGSVVLYFGAPSVDTLFKYDLTLAGGESDLTIDPVGIIKQ